MKQLANGRLISIDNQIDATTGTMAREWVPLWGIRPAEVCGCVMKPSDSSEPISLRTVAGETFKPVACTIRDEPTG